MTSHSFHKRLLILTLLLGSVQVLAQEYKYVETDLESWVGKQPVRSLFFDDNQAVYLATQSGLLKIYGASDILGGSFPGKAQYLIADEIVDIRRIDTHRAVATSSKGEQYLINNDPRVVRENGSSSPSVFRLSMGGDGFLRNGLHSHEPTQTVTKLSDPKAQPHKEILEVASLGICSHFNSQIVCKRGSEPGVTIFSDIEDRTIVKLANLSHRGKVLAVLSGGHGVFVPTSGIGKLRYFPLTQLKEAQIRDTLEVADFVLIATDRGLFSLNSKTLSLRRVPTGHHAQFTHIENGPFGVWAASETGLAHLLLTQIYSWPRDAQNSKTEVFSFTSDSDKGFFIGTERGLYYQRSNLDLPVRIWPEEKRSAEGEDFRISALALDSDTLYVGTFSNGLHVFKISTERATPGIEQTSHILRGAGITAILSTQAGVFIGSYASGLSVLSNNILRKVKLSTHWLKDPAPITSLSATGDPERILLTTENELSLICTSEEIHLCAAQLFDENALVSKPRILSTTLTNSGDIWIGTLNHGLMSSSMSLLLENKPLATKSLMQTGLTSVYSLVLDSEEKLWIGTNLGLFLKKPSSPKLVNFGKLHGLNNTDFHHGSFLRWRGDKVAMGGAFGFDLFGEATLSGIKESPTVRIRSLRFGDEEYRNIGAGGDAPTVRLPYLNKGFDARLVVGDFRSTKNHGYKYKLDGYDTDWNTITSTNIASYTRLPPGDYTFRAIGSNAKGVWSTNEIALPVYVQQSFWRTWQAYLAYSILFLVALYYLKKLNDYRVLREHRLVLAAETTAAFARLEDDYQEQQELKEFLIAAREPAADALLNIMTSVSDSLFYVDMDEERRRLSIDASLSLLRRLQSVAVRTATIETVSLRTVADEAWSLMAANFNDANPIFINDVNDESVSLVAASYLGLVMQECLLLAVNERPHEAGVDPIIEVRIDRSYEDEDRCYNLVVRDSTEINRKEARLSNFLPITHALVDQFDGSIAEHFDRGNELQVSLNLAAIDYQDAT